MPDKHGGENALGEKRDKKVWFPCGRICFQSSPLALESPVALASRLSRLSELFGRKKWQNDTSSCCTIKKVLFLYENIRNKIIMK